MCAKMHSCLPSPALKKLDDFGWTCGGYQQNARQLGISSFTIDTLPDTGVTEPVVQSSRPLDGADFVQPEGRWRVQSIYADVGEPNLGIRTCAGFQHSPYNTPVWLFSPAL